jgi:glyoxylase-like metal-dependent hydrolase (beta-lactamase superfamily II)
MPKLRRSLGIAAIVFAAAAVASAATHLTQVSPNLYVYISDNDHSCNSTFLIGQHGILVVDTGLNATEGQKLLADIRSVSSLPIQFIVNTHYHPDHQGGNGVVGPDAIVISSPFTRERTQQLMTRAATNPTVGSAPVFRLATETVGEKLTIYIDDDPVEIVAPGPAHTMGDVYVFFPKQRTVAAGDVFMANSSPAMDQGNAENWIRALDAMIALPADHYVPGHFELGTRDTITRFRNYMADLKAQVDKLNASGVNVKQVREQIDMSKYKEFRQFPQFHATFADNAETMYRQLHAGQ